MNSKDEAGKGKRKGKAKAVAGYAKRARRELGSMKGLLGASHRDGLDMPSTNDHGSHGMDSVRETIHRGKHILVKTHYDITIDGEAMSTDLSVSDDGSVHYHGLPNYAFASTMDLVRKVIDVSYRDLPADEISTSGKEHRNG